MFDRSKRELKDSEAQPNEDVEQKTVPAGPEAASSVQSTTVRSREAAVIGPSIQIDGDLRGEEDLVIQGTVTGTVYLKENTLTVGANGKVEANIYARSVFLDGTVTGDIYGAEHIAIRKSGDIKGNMVSPRLSIEDGAKFKGTIEMDAQAVESTFGRAQGTERPAAASQSIRSETDSAASTAAKTTDAGATSGTNTGESKRGGGEGAKKSSSSG